MFVKNEVNSINFIDILIILFSKKIIIIIPTLIMSFISVIYILLVPQYWVSVASIKPNTDESQGLNLSSSLLGLGSSLLGGGMTESSAEIITIMNSRKFSQKVINRFDLFDYFEIKGDDDLKNDEKVLRGLREQIMRYNVNPETGLITIAAETKDRYLSQKIVNYYLSEIDNFNLKQRKTKGKQKRVFLEKRIYQIETEIDTLKSEILIFTKETNVVSIEAQTLGIINSYTELISKNIELEIELESLKVLFEDTNIKVVQLSSRIKEVRRRIEELESNSQNKYLLSIDTIPATIIEHNTLQARLELLKGLYKFLYPQYESAKLEELKDIPTIDIVDSASIAGFRSKPKRAQFCILIFLATIIISSTFILIGHFLTDDDRIKLKLLKTTILKSNDSI